MRFLLLFLQGAGVEFTDIDKIVLNLLGSQWGILVSYAFYNARVLESDVEVRLFTSGIAATHPVLCNTGNISIVMFDWLTRIILLSSQVQALLDMPRSLYGGMSTRGTSHDDIDR
jgi:hypothetical protein